MNKKFILGIAASAVLAAGSMITSAAGFAKPNTYTPGMFGDVPDTEWYAPSVSSSYELGFMKGTADGVFSPNDTMTVAEAITVASRVHDAYNAKGTTFAADGANWYDSYVAYAVENGIIANGEYTDFDRPVKRYEMAVIFSKAVPDDYLNAQNDVKKIPDVPKTNAYFDRLQLLYNAGVVMGNDAFGTFKPNNNIIRAEAAAIIGRVAIPESRLQKTLVDADYEDAYYLIHQGQTPIYDSPWNVDNRNLIATVSHNPTGIADYSVEGIAEMWRDIEDVSEGLIGTDFFGAYDAQDGLYFKMTDDDKNEVWALTVKDKKLHFNGKDTGVEVGGGGQIYFTVHADLDNNTADLYLFGKKIEGKFQLGDYTAGRFAVGSGKETMGTITPQRVDVYRNYLVNEIFLAPEDSALSAWDVTGGDSNVLALGSPNYFDYRSAELGTGATAKKTFAKPVSGKVVFETYMLFPKAEDTGFVSLNSGDTSIAKMTVNADGVFKADGTKLRHHTNNIWQTLRIEADTTTGLVTYKINGKNVGEFALDNVAETVDNITIGTTTGTTYFDDVQVYLTHEYDDYVPTPNPVNKNDDYDVILNICSLWREGFHWGWGAESAFEDIEPILGYYDEGLVEVADWELKMWAENGIDVAHFCWYSPSSDINAPIKKSNMNYALHDGYFHAKYSDLVDFTFMWENTGINCQNLEQFKKYIWSYWMDYYFLDGRFYTPDNMITFTAWSYNNFRKAFGDTNAGALEAIEFMNEDAKANGFDGVRIFFADQHQTSEGPFAEMAALGADGSYAYHWNQDGNNANKTIKRMQQNQDYGKIHIVPTVSVGFNNLGWSGKRKPLASLEDHKTVLEYIKNEYLTKEEGWKSKTLIVSTWNEYGEGTYVMPVKALHGYGYLENVAEVISGVTDHSDNIFPTEQQKARLGHLYPDSKTSIARLDREVETKDIPNVPLYTFTGKDIESGQNIAAFDIENDIYTATTANHDPAVRIKDASMADGIAAENVQAIRVEMKATEDTVAQIFFATTDNPNLDEAKSFKFNVDASNEYKTYIVDVTSNAAWAKNVTFIRFDPVATVAEFSIKKIEFLGMDPNALPIEIVIDRTTYPAPFHPIQKNDELYVTADAGRGFFSLHNFYYEWSRYTGVLRLVTKNDREVIFTVGSDIALVDGTETKLAEAFTLRDGLPVIPMYFMYKIADITYELKDKVLTVTTVSEEYQEIMDSRVAYQYEFNIPGDTEGFQGAFATTAVVGGVMKGESVARPGQEPLYDPMLTISELDIDTLLCNKIIVSMKHELEVGVDGNVLEIFFATDSEPGLKQENSAQVKIEGNKSDGFVEYTADFSECEGWKGKILTVRVDPFNCGGSYEIDYIRFVIDEETQKANQEKIEAAKKAEEERLAAGIIVINGDAESEIAAEQKAFYQENGNATVSIVKDEETDSNVWLVEAPDAQVWAYIRQDTVYERGVWYNASVDIKLVGFAASEDFVETQIANNIVYKDAQGKLDHIENSRMFTINTNDGWKTFEFSFMIPEDSTDKSADKFTFYSNPINGKGVSYMLDNIVVQKAAAEEEEE